MYVNAGNFLNSSDVLTGLVTGKPGKKKGGGGANDNVHRSRGEVVVLVAAAAAAVLTITGLGA